MMANNYINTNVYMWITKPGHTQNEYDVVNMYNLNM